MEIRLRVDSKTLLDALYEVRAGEKSFTAHIYGKQDNIAGTAVLDGTIVDGWMEGARVHVTFVIVNGCGEPGVFNNRCFQGTIRILGSGYPD